MCSCIQIHSSTIQLLKPQHSWLFNHIALSKGGILAFEKGCLLSVAERVKRHLGFYSASRAAITARVKWFRGAVITAPSANVLAGEWHSLRMALSQNGTFSNEWQVGGRRDLHKSRQFNEWRTGSSRLVVRTQAICSIIWHIACEAGAKTKIKIRNQKMEKSKLKIQSKIREHAQLSDTLRASQASKHGGKVDRTRLSRKRGRAEKPFSSFFETCS